MICNQKMENVQAHKSQTMILNDLTFEIRWKLNIHFLHFRQTASSGTRMAENFSDCTQTCQSTMIITENSSKPPASRLTITQHRYGKCQPMKLYLKKKHFSSLVSNHAAERATHRFTGEHKAFNEWCLSLPNNRGSSTFSHRATGQEPNNYK